MFVISVYAQKQEERAIQSINEPSAGILVQLTIRSAPWMLWGNTWIPIPSKP